MISERTKAALQAAKARGKRWAAEGAQDPVRSGDTCAWFGCQRGQRSGLRRALASRSR
jgi:hypothetical protein